MTDPWKILPHTMFAQCCRRQTNRAAHIRHLDKNFLKLKSFVEHVGHKTPVLDDLMCQNLADKIDTLETIEESGINN